MQVNSLFFRQPQTASAQRRPPSLNLVVTPIKDSANVIEIFLVKWSVSRQWLSTIPAVTQSIFSTREDPVATTTLTLCDGDFSPPIVIKRSFSHATDGVSGTLLPSLIPEPRSQRHARCHHFSCGTNSCLLRLASRQGSHHV